MTIEQILSRTDAKDLADKDTEILWYRSSLASLLMLAEAKDSPLTLSQVASICKHTLGKFPS